LAIQIVPFEEKYLLDAARILAARHRAHRIPSPQLSERFEDEAFSFSFLQTGLKAEGTAAVVALWGNRVVGFLFGRTKLVPPGSSVGFSWHPRSVSISSGGHAVEPEFSREAYGAMYAAISPQWVAAGLFSHYVILPVYDRSVIETWFSLGFGLDWTYAVRDTSPIVQKYSSADLEIEFAESQDRETILKLLDDLYRYHAGAPCYLPYVPDTATGFHTDNEKAFNDPATKYWVARHQEKTVGVIVVTLSSVDSHSLSVAKPERCPYIHLAFTSEMTRGIGVGTALLNQALAWARDEGFSCCSVEWHTANLVAANFWERCGFHPATYALMRQIDERIAWAHS
jgi:GNAT superfamily N-acetyltransferase